MPEQEQEPQKRKRSKRVRSRRQKDENEDDVTVDTKDADVDTECGNDGNNDNEKCDGSAHRKKAKMKADSFIHSATATTPTPATVATGFDPNEKRRFIAFVGNLPYRCNTERIHTIFASMNVASVRFPTDKETNKPKGFAFVEFADSESLRVCRIIHFHLERPIYLFVLCCNCVLVLS